MRVAIIPARGNSKRIKDKNIFPVAGKELIYWTISAAQESGCFDKIYVDTDSHAIKAIAEKYHAEVPFLREPSLASDNARTSDAINAFVQKLEACGGKAVEEVAILQPTSPLRQSRHIVEAYDLQSKKAALSVVSMCKLSVPIELSNHLGSDLCLEGFLNSAETKRSQEYTPRFMPNGAIYLIQRSVLNDWSKLYGSNSFAYIMDRFASIDIDDYDDLRLAQLILNDKGSLV